MTGLRKFGTKDLGAIVDAAQRYSVGLDDFFTDYIPMGRDLSTTHTLHITLYKNQISSGELN